MLCVSCGLAILIARSEKLQDGYRKGYGIAAVRASGIVEKIKGINVLWFDWVIVVFLLVILNISAFFCRKYLRGVADFLVAGRKVGKYLGITSGEVAAGIGLVPLIGMLQAGYAGGLAYWYALLGAGGFNLAIAISGWGIYRLRESRVMTINELIERRYGSHNLRVLSGIVSFLSAVVGTGILPAVGGNFFVYFCGLPLTVDLLGLQLSTVHIVSTILFAMALVFCFAGGQISVLLTEFIQGTFILIMFIVVGFAVYRVVQWPDVEKVYLAQPNAFDLISPFGDASKNPFNIWFIGYMVFFNMYRLLCWAPSQSARQSATDAKEARLMMLFSYVKLGCGYGLFFYVPAACFAVMHLDKFAPLATQIQSHVDTISNPMVQSQMIVPIFMTKIFPVGLMGLFTATMLSAYLSSSGTLFLSFAGIFVQDIILPLRKTPLPPKQHIRMLRLGTVFVAAAIYLFSLFYTQTEYIYMYGELAMAIYSSGAGVVLLGALYWRRATKAGAWAAMLVGLSISVAGLAFPLVFGKSLFGLNGMQIAAGASIISAVVYFVVSLLTPNPRFDLELLLDRKPKVVKE